MLAALTLAVALGFPGNVPDTWQVAVPPGAEHVVRAPCSGNVHLWALGDGADLVLEVRHNGGAVVVDDDSGGGGVPYLALRVEPDDELAIRVVAKRETDAAAALWIAPAPETGETRAAFVEAKAELRALGEAQQRGEIEAAREGVLALAGRLTALDGKARSGAVALTRRNLGLLAWNLGDVETCAAVWGAAVEHLERTRPESHLELLKLMGNLGLARMQLGERAEAAALHERVAAVCLRTLPADHPDVLVALANLAIVRKENEDLLAAEAIERRVIAAYEQRGDPRDPNLLALYTNHGVTLRSMGDLVGARELLVRALDGYARTHPPGAVPLLRTRTNLAAVLGGLDELEAAREQLERVLQDGEPVLPPGHFDLVRAHINLANVMSWQGDRAGALARYEDLLAELEQQLAPDDPALLAARLNHATSLGEVGRRAEAIERVSAVLDAYERALPPDHADRTSARGVLLGLLLDEGRVEAALELARTLVDDLRGRALSAFSLAPREAREALQTDARWLPWLVHAADRAGADRAGSDPAGSDMERALFELIETRRAVASSLGRGALLWRDDPELRSLAATVQRLRTELQTLVLERSDEDRDARAERLRALSLERDSAERALRAALGRRGVRAEPVDAGALVAGLAPGTALVSFLRCRAVSRGDADGPLALGADRLLAYAVTSELGPRRVDLGPAAELEGLAADWRAALGAPATARGGAVRSTAKDASDVARAGERLRSRLLDPVLELLGDVGRLEVCADDVVHLVPLDALPWREALLGDRLEVVLRPSCAALGAQDGGPATGGLVALGGVDYDADAVRGAGDADDAGDAGDGGRGDKGDHDAAAEPTTAPVLAQRVRFGERFESLSGTAGEVDALAELFGASSAAPATVLAGTHATKAALREALPGTRFVHLATHGWFASEREPSLLDDRSDGARGPALDDSIAGFAPQTLCGLALAGANRALRGEPDEGGEFDGILTAEELVMLDLASCELAVLSACETNVGVRRAGQGIQSLQSALHAAGARSAVTSLWRVDDAATQALMRRFYELLWHAGRSPVEALWSAKSERRAAGHPPRDWAGWVLSTSAGGGARTEADRSRSR